MPAAAVVAAGLRVGAVLDRARARELARALRRAAALEAAATALARRERSVADLTAQLERRGVPPQARAGAVETMARLGYLDDGRLAATRAASLAARGYGDEAIRLDLEQQGLPAEERASAIAALVPEPERAQAIAATAGATVKTARRLAAKGFSDEAIEAAIGELE